MKKKILLKIGWLCALPFMFSSLSYAQYVSPANQLYASPGDYISNVSFNTINKASTLSTSGGATLFGDYSNISTTVNPSSTYSLSVSTFWSEYSGDKLYVYVFFDWNHDYDFTDENEYYIIANGVTNTGTLGHTYNLTAQDITIPSDASLNNIRMRVRMIAATADPGTTGMRNFTGGYYGEIEDYTIVVATPVPAPTITSISPTSGPTTGGTSVVITGTNLTGATAVSFGGTAATGYTINSATQITATSPAKTAGTVDITVTTSGGTSATSSSDQFTYLTTGTFTGASGTDWNTAGNWAGGSVPISTTDVTIPSGKTVVIGPTSSASCKNLTISGTLTVESSSSGTGSLIITGTTTGSASCQRYMSGNIWHLIAPVAVGGSVSSFIQSAGNSVATSGSNYAMMDYNETTNVWNNYFTSAVSGNFAAGKGYAVRRSTDGVVTFTGTLNSGTQTVSVTKNGGGWNLIGNPYSSSIYMNTAANASTNFLKTNAIDASKLDPSYACIYLWDATSETYKILGNSSYGGRNLNINVFAPGQAFFVKAASSGTVEFNTNMQVSQTNSAFKAPVSNTIWPGITLLASGETTSSTTVIAFNANMSKGLDPTFDAGLLRGTNGLSLYTRLLEDNGVDFAIQCLPEEYDHLVIPVGVDCNTSGEITFTAETTGLPEGCKLFLEDKITKTFTSLLGGETYHVAISPANSGIGRFYVHAGTGVTTGTTDLESGTLKVYVDNGTIIISGEVNERAIATLYDMQGQKLSINQLGKGLINKISCPKSSGVYLLTIQQDGKTITRKLINK